MQTSLLAFHDTGVAGQHAGLLQGGAVGVTVDGVQSAGNAETDGTGKWTINGRTLEEYFPAKLLQREVNSPIVLLKLEGKFDAIVLVDGGGTTGQAGAIRLGVARALNAIDRDANRAALKKAGFLTRDARVVERKKAGLHKARRAPQFSKR